MFGIDPDQAREELALMIKSEEIMKMSPEELTEKNRKYWQEWLSIYRDALNKADP